MKISTDIEGNFLLVRIKGDLDMHTVPEFKKKITTIMNQKGIDNLILNLKSVNFIDSTGLGAILGRYRELTSNNGELILIGLTSPVKRIFQLSGVLELISVYESEDDIIEELKGGSNIA